VEKIKIYLGKERHIVEADLVEDRKTTVLVKLPDGNVIKRKKISQIIKS